MNAMSHKRNNLTCKYCGEQGNILAIAEAWYELDGTKLGEYGGTMDPYGKPARYHCDGCKTERKTLKGMAA